MAKKYIVTAHTHDGRKTISEKLSKARAHALAKKIRRENRLAIYKYKWANDIRVEGT